MQLIKEENKEENIKMCELGLTGAGEMKMQRFPFCLFMNYFDFHKVTNDPNFHTFIFVSFTFHPPPNAFRWNKAKLQTFHL